MTTHTLHFGETPITYDVSFAARKTLAINVHPDLRVEVIAPHGTQLDTIHDRVRKRANWILTQQREFELYLPHIPPRQYISGETHRYLGKQYRLRVIEDASAEWVKLERGYLYVRTPDKTNTEQVKALLDGWYRKQARRVFRERLTAIEERFANINLPDYTLQIKTLTARWGSCTATGVITLNLKLMQVPKSYIDYVIAHELCHLIEHNHSKRFYLLLNRIMPDWRQRRETLNRMDFS
jgi:predicted metal-dependent hydrolase